MNLTLRPEQREMWLHANPERRLEPRFSSLSYSLLFILVMGMFDLGPLLVLLFMPALWP